MKKLSIIFLVACCLASCKKFLNEYSQTDITPRSTEHFNEIIFTESYPAEKDPVHPFTTFLDDDVECYYGPTLTNSGISRLAAPIFQWQPDFPEIVKLSSSAFNFNAWGVYYKKILGANVVIQLVEGAEGSRQDKDRIKGEAYVLRAFYHFMLVNLYAAPYNDSTTSPDLSPGVPIRTTADLSEEFLKRNSVREVYTQIEQDLDSAIMLLSKDKTPRFVTRISHVAAHLLASRVYLYEEKWEQAIAHADIVLDNHPQLMNLNTWGGMPMYETKPLAGVNNVESIWCYGNAIEKLPETYGVAYDLSHSLVNSFEPADLRAATGFFVNPPELKQYFAPDFSQVKVFPSGMQGYGTNYDYFNTWRSAEAYLNRAEACIQLYAAKGDAAAAEKALNSLNTLRASRIDAGAFVNWTVKPAAEMLRMCREERRRELYLEELHRWFDLRRYGMPAITHVYRPDQLTVEVYRLEARDRQYLMPIPREVLSRNPMLQPNPQKTGLRIPQ